MKVSVKNASEVGAVVWAARKAQGIRQDDAAGAIGVSENFLGKVERGSETVQWGKLFRVLSDLGIHLELDLPVTFDARVEQLIADRLQKARS